MTKKREYEATFKLVVIGDSGVGKSCLLLRFADDTFSEATQSTIGVDFRFRTLYIDEKAIRVQIWDTAGQDLFKAISPAFYRGSHGIVLVYDVSSKASFDRVEGWLAEARKYADESHALMVGNKADLELREVTTAMGQELADRLCCSFIETSAKHATNVEAAFVTLAAEVVRAHVNERGHVHLPIDRRNDDPDSDAGCRCS